MSHRDQESDQTGAAARDGEVLARRWPGSSANHQANAGYTHGDAWRETREESRIIIVRNDLTVIRGQAQLLKRSLARDSPLCGGEACQRLDAIIDSVDEASLELQHLRSNRRG